MAADRRMRNNLFTPLPPTRNRLAQRSSNPRQTHLLSLSSWPLIASEILHPDIVFNHKCLAPYKVTAIIMPMSSSWGRPIHRQLFSKIGIPSTRLCRPSAKSLAFGVWPLRQMFSRRAGRLLARLAGSLCNHLCSIRPDQRAHVAF